MEAEVLEVRQVDPPIRLTSGEWHGTWTGDTVVVVTNELKTFELRTSYGVRGLQVPCIVTVKNDGTATVREDL
jgi:hypothetical protein